MHRSYLKELTILFAIAGGIILAVAYGEGIVNSIIGLLDK